MHLNTAVSVLSLFLIIGWYMVPPWTLGMRHDSIYCPSDSDMSGGQGHNAHIDDF